MHDLHPLLVVAKTVVLVLGAIISAQSYRAYHRSQDRTFLRLAVGFAIITVGIFLQGILVEGLDWAAEPADLLGSSVSAVGFAITLWSLYS